jgi:sugar lactone lactonase YvrE
MRAIVILIVLGASALAQNNSQPNPYQTIENWAKLPAGRTWGSTSAVAIDRDGRSIWVAERCGANSCAGKTDDPVLHFDASGKLMKSFGSGMLLFPHGIAVDKDDNVWVTDGQARDGKGFQVIKFSPDGKVLMTLGKAGGGADGPFEQSGSFNQPNAVAIAPNGDIFVSEGHNPGTGSARIVKFNKDGKFLKQWGQHGSGPGDFEVPHALAFDSRGRLFVGDRGNGRIQIFDQDGKFIAEWKQFGRPSGIWIDKNDTIYVSDSQSSDKLNPGFKQGIRVGSAKDGTIAAFIEEKKDLGSLEGIGVDDAGNIYAGPGGSYTGASNLRRFVKDDARTK